MSSNSDKVIFTSSLFLAVASGAFFLVGADAPKAKEISITRAAPAPVTIEEPINPLSVWSFPGEQRLLPQDPKVNVKPVPFVLHLFTPPKLYYRGKYFDVRGETPPPKPFPFELKGIYQKPFRIQFGSYSKVGSEVTVYLKDLALRKEIEVKEGDKLPEQGIEIRSVVIEDLSDGGGINKIASVEIFDTRNKKTYKLVEKQPEIMEPTFYAKILDVAAKKDSEAVLGTKLSFDSVSYSVKTLDAASKTVSIEFQTKDMATPETVVLPLKP